MKSATYSLVGILLLLNSCGTDRISDPVLKDFKEQIVLSPVDSINLEMLEILSPVQIQYKKGKLIFKNRQSKFLLSIYDITDKSLFHTLPVGQGPNEAVDIVLSTTYKDDCVSFRNTGTQVVQELMIEPLAPDIATVRKIPEDSRVLKLIETEDYYIGSGVLAEKRFIRIDKHSGKYTYEVDFPDHEKLYGLNQRQLSVVLNGVMLKPKPDGEKFAAFQDGLMNIYSIEDDGIRLLHKKEYYYPSFKILSDQYGALASFDKTAVYGYGGVDADNKYIYVLYSERTFEEKSIMGHNSEYLLIYDWEGNPYKTYKLEKEVGDIAVDNKGNFYGLSFNPEAIVYKYETKHDFY